MTRLFLCLVLSAAASAQTRDIARGRQVLEQAIQALGGPAFSNAHDYRGEGRAYQFSREQLSGMARFVVYEKFPDKQRQEIGKEKYIVFVLNGDRGWDSDMHGVREMPPEEIERIRLNRDLSVDNILRFRLKEEGLEAAHVGTDLVDGRPADLVEVVDAQNRSVTMAFDQSSHLPLRREWERRDPKTREREVNVETLGKYLPVKMAGKGGSGNASPLLAPYYIRRERNGIKVFELFLTELSYDVRLSDSLFQRPSGPERPAPGRKR